MKLRGQAWVVFDDIPQATAAMRALQGFPFHEKPLLLAYSKKKSNAIKIRDGTLYVRETPAEGGTKRPLEEEDGSAKRVKMESEDNALVNNLLFVTNIPVSSVTQDALTALFNQYTGFKEVRIIPANREICFVEFDSTANARSCMLVLDGFEVEAGHAIGVKYVGLEGKAHS
ncbi:hypothetical protein HDV03_003574 [Kappamyces sp. JEL0829]|nr:hypothetical protein HDV03_003574 [Kappamyces sp. JEL0829]